MCVLGWAGLAGQASKLVSSRQAARPARAHVELDPACHFSPPLLYIFVKWRGLRELLVFIFLSFANTNRCTDVVMLYVALSELMIYFSN